MNWQPIFRQFVVIVLALQVTGCGTFVAHRIMQAPNTYPTWVAPQAPVTLAYDPKFITNFPRHYVVVGEPPARLSYRVIDPADYAVSVTSSNWVAGGKKQFEFDFDATVPGASNAWTDSPRGTVFLLHGYGLAQFSMAPWALKLAQAGWRCVLVDLRGHGKSGGKQIYFGLHEANDLTELLNHLASDGKIAPPVAAMGESYGAALALRWQTVEPRLQTVVAIAPYASLSNAVLNISHDYAGWVPDGLVRAGLLKLPVCLGVPASELDTTTVMKRKPVKALFIAGAEDSIAPVPDVTVLQQLALPGSPLIVVPNATHEALTYYFSDLTQPVLDWLAGEKEVPESRSTKSGQ